MVEPPLWLASEAAASITGTRLNAARWGSALAVERLRSTGFFPAEP